MIFNDKDREQVLTLQQKLFDLEIPTYDEYLRLVEQVFSNSMIAHFCSDSLLHRLYYIDEFEKSEKYRIIRCAEDFFYSSEVSSYVLDEIKKLENKVASGEVDSFITLAYEKRFLALCFFMGPSPGKINLSGVVNFNLQDSNSKFYKLVGCRNEKRYSSLLDTYRRYSEKNEDKIYCYVIQSTNLDRHFNGSLFLVLNRPLSIDEYFSISTFYTFVMQARIKYEYKKVLLNKTVIDELSHSMKHDFGALRSHIDSLKKELGSSTKIVSELLIRSENQIGYLNVKTNFMLNMMRAGVNAENYHKLSKSRQLELKRKPCSVKEYLTESTRTIFSSIRDLGFNESWHRENVVESCIPSLFRCIEMLPDKKLFVIPVGLHLVIEEILKNAIFHTDPSLPKVRVYFTNDENALCLKFKNNIPMTKEIYEYITYGKDVQGMSKRGKVGIRTAKRIVAFPRFNRARDRWLIQADKPRLESNDSVIYLRIPLEDIEL